MLPHVKPYSREQILSIIDEILINNEERRFGGLTEAEGRILEQFRQDFTPSRQGFNLIRGTISTEHTWNNVYFSAEFGFGLDMAFAGSVFSRAGGYQNNQSIMYQPEVQGGFEGASHPSSGDSFGDYYLMPSVSFLGDLGRNLSYGLTISGWGGRSPRAVLGTYNNLWAGYTNPDPDDLDLYRSLTIYSEPLAYFPFTYKKLWDGFLHPAADVSSSGQVAWPNDFSLGYSMKPEMAGEIFNGHFFYRFARIDREWGGMTSGSSLVFNQNAQPFLAIETVIQPFPWISFSSLTGVLEYHNAVGPPDNDGRVPTGMIENAEVFQNAFSIVMLEFNIRDYFHIGFGSSVIWPKRFELAYLFPFADNFLAQNNTGDFDNLALFLNLQGQYPGIGKLWFSIFFDELNPQELRNIASMDRMMFALQVGGSFHIPWLPFSSITASYTKVEPYNYTHVRETFPWYGDNLMETNYVSFGRSLGHYIPPNSDEFLIRFDTLPTPESMLSFQYQLIRHGANYGNRAVDGSSLWSELDPCGDERSNNPALRKNFLRDGAYQWMHILRLRGEYSFTGLGLPVRVFAEVGGVFSYFTDIFDSEDNFRVIDIPEYPRSTRFIAVLGFRIFPKF
jgi:hypothetical protein